MITTNGSTLARSLARVQATITSRLTDALAKHDCTLEEWWVLDALAADSGRPMNELSSIALLPKPSLTKLVDRMVSDNLVFRRHDVEDRRRILLFPTVQGLEKHAVTNAAVEEEQRSICDLVGEDCMQDLEILLSRAAGRLS